VIEAGEGGGWARVHGESWRVRSSVPLHPGQTVHVTGMKDLELDVIPEAPATKETGHAA